MGGRDLSRSSFLGGARNTPPQPKRAAITQKGNILQPTPKTATQRLVWGRSAVALDVFNLSGGDFVARGTTPIQGTAQKRCRLRNPRKSKAQPGLSGQTYLRCQCQIAVDVETRELWLGPRGLINN